METTTIGKPVIRYSHAFSEGIPHSEQPRSVLVKLAKKSMAHTAASSAYMSRSQTDLEKRSLSVNATAQGKVALESNPHVAECIYT